MKDGLLPTSPEGRLYHLIEEAGEVIQSAAKLMRFGPMHTFGGVSYNNKQQLLDELQDLETTLYAVRTDLQRAKIDA
jgi:NTP pyrophosphatase (non-canonical NTP hydrolase)